MPDSITPIMQISRRDLLTTFGPLAAGTLLFANRSRAQAPSANPHLIDIHRHFISPAFLKVLNEKQGKKVPGFTGYFPLGPWNNYSPARDIETMDQQGIATSVVSTTSPGTWFGNRDETRALAREMNEFGATMMADHKGRFGLFALLPMPSVDDCLKEIEYAFDTLKADGVGLLTSYGTKYLGDAAFQPIFDELNHRKAVVYTHPIDAPCCQDIALTGVTPTTLEFPTDTARCILSLLSSAPNTPSPATRYADTRFIFSHGGGTLPAIIGRIQVGGPDDLADNLARPAAPNSRLAHLRRFYYDTAMATNPVQIGALKTIAGAAQILFGTDYPFGGDAVKHRQGLEKCGLSEMELRGVFRENSASLLPKYRA
jgi:predicted TIM-barrel fold metal-dependent hydrolase